MKFEGALYGRCRCDGVSTSRADGGGLLSSPMPEIDISKDSPVTAVGSALIIEDHPLYRDALVQLLRSTLGTNAALLVASSAEEGVRLARTCNDLRLVMIDPGLPGISGTEAVAAICTVVGAVPVIAVSASEERRHAAATLRGGACIFVSKAVTTEVLAGVVQRALAGQIEKPEWITPSGANAIDDNHDSPLTSRQREILGLIAQGYANKEIGLRLNLAEVTVKMHVSSIFRALDVASRTQAVRAARNLGWFAFEDNAE